MRKINDTPTIVTKTYVSAGYGIIVNNTLREKNIDVEVCKSPTELSSLLKQKVIKNNIKTKQEYINKIATILLLLFFFDQCFCFM